jgi:hypothetical protein
MLTSAYTPSQSYASDCAMYALPESHTSINFKIVVQGTSEECYLGSTAKYHLHWKARSNEPRNDTEKPNETFYAEVDLID